MKVVSFFKTIFTKYICASYIFVFKKLNKASCSISVNNKKNSILEMIIKKC